MTNAPLVLTTVSRSPSLYETVSQQLLAAIREAGLEPGAKIPSERELGQQFGVSRTVIREAVRHLEAKGVLKVLTGSGVLVADVGHEGVSQSLDLYLRQRGPIDPRQVHEVRESLELTITRIAAERATDEQLATALSLCDQLAAVADDPAAASIADVAFHRVIAEGTGNPLFLVLIDSLAEVMLELRRATLVVPDRARIAAAAHRRVAEALQRRDADAAVAAMREHLDDSRQVFAEATSA